LSEQFIVIGHSQGGGAAWSTLQNAVTREIPGCLGAIAVSPYTSVLGKSSGFADIIAAAMCPGIDSAFPDFVPGDCLTAEGDKRLETVHRTGAAVSSAVALLSGIELLKPNWRNNVHLKDHQRRTSNGGKAIKGPLLIIHGKSDPVLSVTVVENAVKMTAERFPSAQIQYISLPKVTHVSALAASQHHWMDWIADRFAGREVESGRRWNELACARPHNAQQTDQNWYLELATKPYHAPGP
jgi:pimeloyl-ACP methyl ester carboxylesterase